ncbi:hypothetical protein [Haloferula sargassicola]|uniref:Uncharacterized protein n=1 Tax=Haloferula sargassicola TaxID=490096 RepID=A0ABP9UL25_9BACT
MKSKGLILTACAILGFGVGLAVLQPWEPPTKAGDSDPPSSAAKPAPSADSPGPETAFGRLVRQGSPNLLSASTRDAAQALADEKRSPLRTRAFLRTKIELMDHDQLVLEMMDGDIDTLPEIRAATRRLTLEDPEGTFTAYERGLYRLNTMEKLYAFLDTLLHTWTDADAPALLSRLKAMKRGGSQQDASLRFSDYWAGTQPEAAAQYFTDLISIRNMDDFGRMAFNEQGYARKIAEAWQRTDEEGLREFVSRLPKGSTKTAFGSAIKDMEAAH